MMAGAGTVEAVARRLAEVTGSAATPTEIMDVLWLYAHLPALDATPQRDHGQAQTVPPPAPAPAPAPSGPVPAEIVQPIFRPVPSAIVGNDANQTRVKPATVSPSLVVPESVTARHQPGIPHYSGPVAAALRQTQPSEPALRDPLGACRALRPLQIRLPSARFLELDEVATAERRARLGWWEPVLRPRRTRWPDAAVVVACHRDTLPIWTATTQRLLKVFERLGAFRELRTWRLLPPEPGKGQEPRICPYVSNGVADSRPASNAITDPTGRRLVLVITDGAGPHWTDRADEHGRGLYLKQLQDWTKTNPVAMISLVPLRQWPEAVLRAVPGEVWADYPLQPNQLWKYRVSGGSPGSPVRAPVVPVADLNTKRLEWLAAALCTRSLWTATALVAPGTGDRRPAPQSAYVAVKRFRARAQPRAFGLLSYLSAAPLLQPLIDRVRQTVMPQARNEDLQEIFLSDLVETAEPEELDPADVMALRFRRAELRQEMAVRLHPEADATIQWDLRAHAQDALSWEPDLTQALLDKPDHAGLLRLSASGADRVPAGLWTVPVREPSKFEIWLAEQLDQKHRPHLAVAGITAPGRAFEITQLAQGLATLGVLQSDQPRTIAAADLAAAKADPVLRHRIAEDFADAVGLVVIDVPPWLCDDHRPGVDFAVSTLVEQMLQQRPGQLVVLSGEPGPVGKLRQASNKLAELVPPDRVLQLEAERFDEAYLVLQGTLRRNGLTVEAQTPAALWNELAKRYRQAPEDFYGVDQARALAEQLVVNWRERTGGDSRQPVTSEDIMDTSRGGAARSKKRSE